MLRRSAARRYVELGKPSERYGIATLAAGWLSLLPVLAPFAAAFATATALLGTLLAGRFPERYAGGRKMVYGLLLSVAGMGLFMVEAPLFWRWKCDQSYEQRLDVTEYRLGLVAGALGKYRQEMGAYPEVSGIQATRKMLEPKYAAFVPILDGFEGAISVNSRQEGFTLVATPPPRPRTSTPAPPMVVEGGFQPAPSPPLPPPPEVPVVEGTTPSALSPAQGTPPPASAPPAATPTTSSPAP